jgi:hypothetical protein
LNASENKPEVRSGLVQNGLKALELLDPAAKKRILDRFPNATLQAINSAKENDWLPLEFDIQLSDNTMAEISEEEFIKTNIANAKLSIESSVLGPFVLSALHLFRISPTTVFKVAPHIWNSCYRHYGKISIIQKGKGCLQVLLEDLPMEYVKSKPYLISNATFIQTLLEFTGVKEVKVVIEEQSIADRSVVIAVSWDTDK